MAKGGNRVRWEANERADLPDVQDLSELVFEYIQEAIAGALGFGQGALSRITFDTSSLTAVEIGACWLYHYEMSGDGTGTGYVIKHDPTATGQSSTVNLNPYSAGSGTPFIWARVTTVNIDTENRRVWDVIGEEEDTDTFATRTVSRIQWGVGIAEPSGATGWFKVARVYGWVSPSAPLLVTIHAADQGMSPSLETSDDEYDITKKTLTGWMRTGSTSDIDPDDIFLVGDYVGSAGIFPTLRSLAIQVWTLAFQGSDDPVMLPVTAPVDRGVYELHRCLTHIERKIHSISLQHAEVASDWTYTDAGAVTTTNNAMMIAECMATSHTGNTYSGVSKKVSIRCEPGDQIGFTIQLWKRPLAGSATLQGTAAILAGAANATLTITSSTGGDEYTQWWLRIIGTGVTGGTDAKIVAAFEETV